MPRAMPVCQARTLALPTPGRFPAALPAQAAPPPWTSAPSPPPQAGPPGAGAQPLEDSGPTAAEGLVGLSGDVSALGSHDGAGGLSPALGRVSQDPSRHVERRFIFPP